MKAAGLNPALMYAKGGMSADTPSGSSSGGANTASTTGRATQNPGSNIGQLAGMIGAIAFSSAKAVTLAKKTVGKSKMMLNYGIPKRYKSYF